MCGVNKGQFRLAVGQVDDAVSMSQQWLEQLHALADNGGMANESRELAQANVLLGEARARLERIMEGGSQESPGVTVEAV